MADSTGTNKINSAVDEGEGKLSSLEKNFSINFDQFLKDLSTPFARAYSAAPRRARDSGRNRPIYALVFEHTFPPAVDMINFLHNIPNDEGFFLSVLESGVTNNKGVENLAVVIEQPTSKSLAETFAGNPTPDKFLINNVIAPLNEMIGSLVENRLMHGRINADNIFFNPQNDRIIIGSSIAEPCGYSQPVIYEPLERAICSPLGKGDGHYSADYYALGVLILFLVTGKPLLPGIKDEELLDNRFELSSFTAMTQGLKVPGFVSELLKGLLSDNNKRWGYLQVDSWIRKKSSTTPPAINREAIRGFAYKEKEYFSTRYLAHAFFRDFLTARHILKPNDLSRWLKHSVLKPELSEKFDALPFTGKHTEGTMLQEGEVARTIALLDPIGPIRLGTSAIDIYGLGQFLAYGYATNNKEYVQIIGDVFTSGLMQFWLEAVDDSEMEDDRYKDLSWSPRKILNLIRKSALGFGMERVLYEINHTLPCQSKILGDQYIDDLSHLLKALDRVPRERHEQIDPIDRHIAGFIATKIDLREEVNLKKLTEFPKIAQSPQIAMLALLLAAQTVAKVKNLKNLSSWIAERLLIPLQSIRSHNIRDEMIKNIRRAARDGNLQEIYQIVSSAKFLRQDDNGFKEASRYYHMIGEKIIFIGKSDNNEKLAYEYGLRAAVVLSYMTCALTLIYLLGSL